MSKRILYVEDNANTAMALKVMLELKGYSVVTVASVKQARAVLSTDTFDVLISDISLPDGQGWDIIETTDAKLRSIALSGYTADKDKQAALSHGFTAFLTKPFATAELIDTIERA